MTDLQWSELVDKTKHGDKKAFEQLYNETKRSVYFTALKLLANEDNAKDVMQDTFMTAIEKLNDLDDAAKFPKWVNSIAVNKCRRYFRKTPEDSLDEQTEQGLDLKDDDSFIPEEYVSDSVKRKVIMDIITKELSEVQRQTIIMYYYDDMSPEEITKVMDCPVKTVSSRLCSARKKIKEAVLIYEKKHGDRLHSAVPVPILTKILRMEAEKLSVPDIPLDIFAKILSDAAAKASASTIVTGTKAGGSIMTKLFSVKVIAGVLAATVVGGGVTAAVTHNNNSSDTESTSQTSSIVSQQETVTEAADGNIGYDDTAVTEQTAVESKPEDEPYVPLDLEMNADMKAKLDELRAKGAETVELKWGTMSPIPFVEASTGEKTEVRCNGTFTYFPEATPDMDEDYVKMCVLDCLQPVLWNMSGHFDVDQLPAEMRYISEQVQAEVANTHGVLLDSLTINSITKPQDNGGEKTAETTAVTTTTAPKEETSEVSDKYKDLFFKVGYKDSGLYNVIFMLPADNRDGERVQIRNGGTALWKEGDVYEEDGKTKNILYKDYTVRFGVIEPANRKSGMAPAEEIKDYLLNGYDYKSIHVNAFDTAMEDSYENILPAANAGSMTIEKITSEEKATVLEQEAKRLKGYFTYREGVGNTERVYFSACIGTFDYEPQGNNAGGLPYYMIIAYTNKDFTEDAEQQKQCDRLVDVAINEMYYKDDPNAPKAK